LRYDAVCSIPPSLLILPRQQQRAVLDKDGEALRGTDLTNLNDHLTVSHRPYEMIRQGETRPCVFFRHSTPYRHSSRVRLHLQLLNNEHQLVLYLPATPETFWKLTKCLAAGKQ
jgi:hypothetical protein